MFNKKMLKRKLSESSIHELINFIRKEFPSNGQDYVTQNNKLQVLKALHHADLSAAIARMAKIEKAFDVTLGLSTLTILFTGAVIVFKLVFGESIPYLIFVALFVICLSIGVPLDRRKQNTAVYFKELLVRVKEDKNNGN
ncbi:hypothetical protein [Bacillus atrophaeus]|uniref:hypothetical protein n=1 Tax=Bacillus atrophaeus TaxID=1452 RepID=UPI00228169C6|nr:hypothetical protein [Bacillus atrophaeus]MCY8922039.1 hypothetical protein [Bacillus atrophaeus]MCY9166810.1 hypothetical protein [Bacillus atrophaeus]